MVDVVYEDNHIIVVIKPHNIPSQEDESGDKDMLNMVKEYVKEKYNKEGNVYIGLVHRLDRPTGGLMVFARTSKAAARLCEEIKNGDFEKKYLAVTVGKPREKSARLENFLKKDEKSNIVSIVPQLETGAKRAELVYETLEVKDELALLKVKILTGRSHQIRVQLSNINTPIFGDTKYGGTKTFGKGYNLALWAGELRFVHPTTKEIMVFKAEPDSSVTPWRFFNLDKYFVGG